MSSRERIEALKDLVKFLRQFTGLIEQQLNGIRHYMSETVEQVMSSIGHINSVTSTKKQQVQKILAADGAGFSVDMRGNKEALESELERVSEVFSKEMESIINLDNEVRDVLSQTVGVLSADDVMGQRLSHAIGSLSVLSFSLGEYMKSYPEGITRAGFARFRNGILTDIYRSYSMEEERKIFHAVFGAPERPGVRAS